MSARVSQGDDGARPRPVAARRRVLVVDVYDDQAAEQVDGDRWSALARAVLEDLGAAGDDDAELTVTFVDEDRIAALNAEHLGGRGPTDVLSFPLDGEPEPGSRVEVTPGPADADAPSSRPPLLLGDVVICPAVAARNAPTHAGTYDDELALLLVHGILHLLGHDHAEPSDEAAMQARERELLARHHRGRSA